MVFLPFNFLLLLYFIFFNQSLLRVVSNSSKEAELVAKSAMLILAPRQGSLEFITSVLYQELEAIHQSSKVVADSVPLTTRVAAAYVHSFGAAYLKKTLQAVVSEICTSTRGFEVDQNYLSAGENLQRNMDSLVMASYKIVSCIVNSLSSCPGSVFLSFFHFFIFLFSFSFFTISKINK